VETWITSGAVRFVFDERNAEVAAGEVIVIPPNVSHSLVVLEDATFVDFFAPPRQDFYIIGGDGRWSCCLRLSHLHGFSTRQALAVSFIG
jgi:quercetin dioxygenase-like cupin family protein